MCPNIFMIFWSGDSDRDGKWRQARRGTLEFVVFWGFKHEFSRIDHEFLLLLYKKIIKKVKMADNLGPMAWLFLQENVLPQWQQKIALRAENKRVREGHTERTERTERG